MKIETLKDLEALFKLCQRQGIDKISLDGITIEFGAAPARKTKLDDKAPETDPGLTDEQLALYSVHQA